MSIAHVMITVRENLGGNTIMRNDIGLPSIIQRAGLGVHVFITWFAGLASILGSIYYRDAEMATVFMVLMLICATLVFFTRRKFKKYYAESDDYFLVKTYPRATRVYYDDISDWEPLSKKIRVLDKTRKDNRYVCVFFKFSEPERLLRKLTEMTFAGKFNQSGSSHSEDPNREQELINHLRKNGYEYIIEEVLEEQRTAKGS